VTITGTGFGVSQGSSAVLLNDAPVTINGWGSASISIMIPTGATSGPLVVSVAPTMNDTNAIPFSVTSNALPSPWLDQDIGVTGIPGSATYSSGVFTVNGAGNSLSTSGDGFHFVYQQLTTDGTIIARVASQGTYSQAGVIIRETLGSDSTEIFPLTYSFGSTAVPYMDYRTVVGGGVSQSSISGVTLPYWVKAVRVANTFTGYASPDGATWTQIGSPQTFATAQTVYIGLGFSSGNNSTLGTGTFDNVSVVAGSSLSNPVVSGYLPGSGGPGKHIEIDGTGFGLTQGLSAVFFNGVQAAIVSWSANAIVAAVPDAATSGPISVVVGNITGQGPTFNVVFGVQLTDSLGNHTDYHSSLAGGEWVITDGQGSGCSSCTIRGNVTNQYDTNGNRVWSVDALGHTTTNRYDTSNNLIAQTNILGLTTTPTTTYSYNSLGEVTTVQDPLSHTTTNYYDGHGNLTDIYSPNGEHTRFTYNSVGQLTTIADPSSNVTTLAYTTVGLIHTITDAQSNVTTYGYDAHGNRISVTDALSHQTTFAYDSGDRLTTITYPDSTTTTFGYDYRGRRTSVTDQNGKTTAYAFDDADRLTSVTDAASNITTYGYDNESNLTSITDANSHTTYFTYDAYGRVTQTNFPSTLAENYTYDANNNLATKTDRKGQTITYVYDALNRLAKKEYPDSSEVDYVYDLVGKIQQVNDPTGTYSFAYDSDGRLIGTTTAHSFLPSRNLTTSYGYDAASNRTSFTDPESGSTTYSYDTLNRLETLTPPTAFAASGNFGFTYDALSRRTEMTRPNSVTTDYTYDNLSHLLSVLHKLSGSTIDGASYTVDNAGNRSSKADQLASVTTNYTYDSIYQLTQAVQGATTTESYSYDPVGNRTASLGVSSYANNVSNQLTAKTGASYGYDYNGNTVTKNDTSGITTYAWDYENRLTSVTLPGTGATVSFKYDPFDRRIYKCSSSGTSIYAYDGDNLIEETNAAGTAVARYSQGLNVDKPYALLRSGATSYYEVDGLGSTTSLSNAAGALPQTYTFDSFGKQTASTGSLTNPFQYTAREFDPETNLYFYRARYYDPAIGRFISEDPVGFFGGVNFYAYVNGNPINYRDPSGQWPVHGKWCGPTWTGGHWEQYDPSHDKNGYYKDPVDPTDAVCKDHDICYYRCRTVYPCDVTTRGRCMREICDARLMLNTPTSGFWGPIISSGIDFFNGHPDVGDNDENCPNCTPKRRGGGKK